MISSFNRIFTLFLTFSTVISGWTIIILLSNSIFKSEIKDVINKMYINQKQFIINVKDLSKLLVKDANSRLYEKNNIRKEKTHIIQSESLHKLDPKLIHFES